jgi:hypothetical protein
MPSFPKPHRQSECQSIRELRAYDAHHIEAGCEAGGLNLLAYSLQNTSFQEMVENGGMAQIDLTSAGLEMYLPKTGEPLRLLAVHAHPDDESSKGSASTAKYVNEGVQIMVVSCTGGERGDILNPGFELGDRSISDVRK